MGAQRQFVDYSLRRRALLKEVYAGRVGTYEVCDASPYLRSAAKFHGEPTEDRCPVCRRENLTHVHYIYGDELKTSAGQARRKVELDPLAATFGEFQVYVVEVCRGCGWNHLVAQYLLGREVDVQESAPTGNLAGAGRPNLGGAGRAGSSRPGVNRAGTTRPAGNLIGGDLPGGDLLGGAGGDLRGGAGRDLRGGAGRDLRGGAGGDLLGGAGAGRRGGTGGGRRGGTVTRSKRGRGADE